MATKSDALTSEDVIIELKTNFAEELPRMLTQYTGFITKTGNVSRSLERAVTNMSKTVSVSVQNMFSNSAKEVVNSMQQVRGLASQIANQGVRVNQLYLDTFNKLTNAQQNFQSEIKQTEKAIASLRNTERLNTTPENQRKAAGERATELEAKKRTLMTQLESESIKLTDEFNRRLGSIAAQTSKNFVKTAETNLQSVKGVINDINKQLNIVESRMGMQTDLSKIFSMQKVFDDMKMQHGSLQKTLVNQSKLTFEAEKQMLIAKEALNNSVSDKVKQKNQEAFQKTLENQLKVKKTFNELEKEVYEYGKALTGTENKIKTMASALQKSIKVGIKPSEVTEQMKKAFQLLVEEAQLSGKKMGDALMTNMNKSKELELALTSKIQKLKEFRSQALQLQKTGLVDTRSEVSKIDTIINKYQAFYSEFKKQQSMIRNILGQQKGMQIEMGTAELNKVRKIYNDLSNEVQKYTNVSSRNYAEAHDNVKKLQSLWDQYLTKYRQVNERKKSLQSEMHKVELAMAKTTNAQLLAELDNYYNKLKAKMKGVQSTLSQPFESSKVIDNTFSKIKNAAKTMQADITKSFASNLNHYKNTFNVIKGEFDSISDKADKLYKKRFISNESIAVMKKSFDDAKNKAKEYEDQLEKLKYALRQLEELQRRGLGGKGIQAQIEQMKTFTSQMKSHITSLNAEARRTQTAVEGLHKKALKSVLKNTWEMVRNFRWQVAAVIYLISRGTNAVKRTFFGIIDEAMEFRKNAMSIAASVSYQMMGDMEKNYKKAYQFSKQLMNQLEMEAARTILTLEDMMMLTKTFAQAGIIPDTAEDVRRISTIGVAIKALTEGMANAGVQMRQELYSVIVGRQRAVDQLAMMFKMTGTDINKLIDDVKKNAKTAEERAKAMMIALSDALESSFGAMAAEMKDSYATVVNELQVIWGIIKRLAADPVMDILTKQFKALSAALYDENKKVLTDIGEDAVKALRSVLTGMMTVGRSLLEILGSVMSVIANIINAFFPVKQNIDGMNNGFNEANSRLSAIHSTSELVAKGLLQIELIIYDIVSVMDVLIKSFSVVRNISWDIVKILGKGIRGIVLKDFSELKEVIGTIKGRVNAASDSYENLSNITEHHVKRVNDVDEAFNSVFNSVNNISNELDKIDTKWSLPNKIEDLAVQAAKWQKEVESLTKQSLEGPEKFKYEYDVTVGKNDEFREQLEENIKKRTEDVEKYGHELTDKQREMVNNQLKFWKEGLGQIAAVEKAAYNKMLKQRSDYYSKASKQAASARKEIESFLIQTREKPETRLDKIQKWYELTEEKIKEMIATSKEAAARAGELWQALEEGHSRRLGIAIRENTEEYEAFIEKITSHEVLNQFEAIDNEMNKINLAIRDAINLSEEEKKVLKEKVEVAREQRKEIEKTALVYQNQMKKLDLLSQKANYMQGSYSPLKQMEGDILSLYASYQKELAEIDRQIEEIVEKFKEPEGVWSDHSKEMQEYYELLREQYRLTTEAFERDVWKKQNPMWNDLIEMSKSWSDSIADSLTDLVLDFENFGESIKKVWESIVKDTLRIIIQRKMMEPLMDALGSGEPGSETLYQKMTGKEALGLGANLFGKMSGDTQKQMSLLDQIIGSGQAMPVYIVDSPFLEDLPNSINKTTKAITEAGKSTDNTVKEGFRNNGSILSQLLSALWSSKAGQAVSNIGSTIMRAVGSYYGMNTGAPAHVGAGGTTAFGMAEGGTISEHIVGKGLSSGRIYEFGEKSKYGEFEDVVPRSKMRKMEGGKSVTMSMPININAIDTQSGVDFILKNQKLIEANMLRSLKNNKAIRGMIRQSW